MAYLLCLLSIINPPDGWEGGDFNGVMFLSTLLIPLVVAGIFLVVIFVHLNMKRDITSLNLNVQFWTYLIIAAVVSALVGAMIINSGWNRIQSEYPELSGKSVLMTEGILLNMITSGLFFWLIGMIVSDYLGGLYEGLFPKPFRGNQD